MAWGCTDAGTRQDGRRRREAGRAAARPPTLALGGRDAGEEGGYDGLKAPSGGRFCFSQEVGRTCKPFGCSVPAERLGLSLQQESAQPGLLAYPNRPIRDPRNRQVFKPLVQNRHTDCLAHTMVAPHLTPEALSSRLSLELSRLSSALGSLSLLSPQLPVPCERELGNHPLCSLRRRGPRLPRRATSSCVPAPIGSHL